MQRAEGGVLTQEALPWAGRARGRAEGLCLSAPGRGRRGGGDGRPPQHLGGLTISPTRCGPGSRCPGPASRARTSRAAGSSATSPAPGEAEGLALGEGRKGALRSHDPGPSEQTTWRAFPPEVRLGAHPHGQLGSGQGWQNDPLPLRARDAGAGPALTALKDASRGQWPKQCCRNRYSFCWTNLGTAALRGTGPSPHRAQATASRVQPLPQRTPQGHSTGDPHGAALPAPAGRSVRPRLAPAGVRGGDAELRPGSPAMGQGSETGLPAAPTSLPGGVRGLPLPRPTS